MTMTAIEQQKGVIWTKQKLWCAWHRNTDCQTEAIPKQTVSYISVFSIVIWTILYVFQQFFVIIFHPILFVNVSFAIKIIISWRVREKNKFSFRFSFVLTKCCRFHFSKHFAKTVLTFQSHSCVEWHV